MALTVEQLYQQYAGRASDPGGLQYWTQQFGDTIDLNEISVFQNAIAEARAQGTEPAAQTTQLTPKQIANTPGLGSQGIGVNPSLGKDAPDYTAAAQMMKEDAASAESDSAKELADFKAQTDAQLRADEEAFARSRAEIEAMTRQEEETIRQQTADYEAAQERIRAESAAQAQAVAFEQAMIQRQIADIQAQQAADAAKAKGQMEGMQRESAQKQAAAKKAGRSAGARPLLAGATPDSMGQGGQSLGSEGLLSGQPGSLGAQQTLGV